MLRRNDSPRPVAPAFVAEALGNGAAAGIDIPALLTDLGLAKADLAALDTAQFARIWLELSLRMRDEFFGLGQRAMRPGTTTLIGHAIRGAPRLDVALRRLLRFLNSVLDDPLATLEIQERNAAIIVHEAQTSGNAFKFRTFYLIVHGFACWAVRERIPIKAMHVPCPAPSAGNDYADFFGVPVSFDASDARLVFDTTFLSRPVDRSEAELKTFLRSLPQAFLRGYRDTDGIKHLIVERCLSCAPADWPGAEGVAQQLGVSRSTLHRMLAQSGLSLTQLKDEQRRNRATALLSRTQMTIAEVSAAVGYAEEGAFYRAFRRWYSTHPSALRPKGRN